VTRPARRPATPEEAKALAHPVRQRIVRLCGTRERTNKELADRLGRDPATVLPHVRQLVAAGFLEPAAERVGPSGATEKPYRSTGVSWSLSLDTDGSASAETAMLDATREELLQSGPDAVETAARLVVRLTDAQLAEVLERLRTLVDEVVARSAPLDDETLPAYGALVLVHRFPEPGPADVAPADVRPAAGDEAPSEGPPSTAPQELDVP
jgi:predicted ArsR family transcriptional regulator